MKYVPDQYITQETCNEARNCLWLIGHVPDYLKTKQMCTRVLEVCRWSLEYIPDWFVMQQQIKLWCDHDHYFNDDRLIKCHEGYHKRNAWKASIKEELLPIAWHPSRYWDWYMTEEGKKDTEKIILTTWHAEIKNVLIKRRCLNLVKKRLQLKSFMDKDK